MNRKILYIATALLFAVGASIGMAEERGMKTDETPRVRDRGTADVEELAIDTEEARYVAQEAVEKAALVIQEVTHASAPAQMIPADVLRRAQGIVIVPGLVKAGLIAGGQFGRGVLVTKNQDQWSLPVIVTVGGASLGAQIGVESSDVVMVFQNKGTIDKLLQDNEFTLGADASVAAGTAGARAEMRTDADIITYKRTKGLFAGVTLNGSVLDIDAKAMNAYYRLDEPPASAYYGQDERQTAQNIMSDSAKEGGQTLKAPASAQKLQDALAHMISTRP